jgi:hypothetical protein
MEKLTDRARRLFLQSHSAKPSSASSVHHGQTGCQGSIANYYSSSQSLPNLLPKSFSGVHPYLVRYLEQIRLPAAPHPYLLHHPTATHGLYSHPQPGIPLPASSETDPRAAGESWMPDIYQYASVGVGVEERYTRAQAQPTPFIPSSPRVDQNDTFNFDHGALVVDLEETSYMAWF